MNSYILLVEVLVVYTLCIIHLIILSELYSIMHKIIQIRVLVIRWLTLEMLMHAVDITKHDPSFVFSRVKATGTYNNLFIYLLNIIHSGTPSE